MTAGTQMQAQRTWRNYFELTKPKVVALIVFTAIVGSLLKRSAPKE